MDGRAPGGSGEVTVLLRAARDGDRAALDRLLPLLYEDLRAVAEREMRREASGHTLQPTALVHEAYLRLTGAAESAADRAHFLAIAARAMRQVLVDHARRRSAAKRGGGMAPTTLTDGIGGGPLDAEEILALDRALETLEPRQRRVVECRFFAGMEETEIAAALDLSERTVRRDWAKARAWLYRELYPGSAGAG
ncbi:MAG: sigma-70 family RNA polymerase sigma factor [Gemmatimonadota bacterium]|jgi:RNA polymerase sigma factor (TIGR02999 family)